jgi:hypothetical protein
MFGSPVLDKSKPNKNCEWSGVNFVWPIGQTRLLPNLLAIKTIFGNPILAQCWKTKNCEWEIVMGRWHNKKLKCSNENLKTSWVRQDGCQTCSALQL